MASLLPQCVSLVHLEETGHMAPIERPAEVTQQLRRLASEHLVAPRRVRAGRR
jgi:pimeloyl-ACP methyl ester carboxylesterase